VITNHRSLTVYLWKILKVLLKKFLTIFFSVSLLNLSLLAQGPELSYFHTYEEAAFCEQNLLSLYTAVDSTLTDKKISLIHQRFDELIHRLERKTRKDTAWFVEKLFYYIHRKTLKRYQNFSLMSQTMLDNTYDCISGTALMVAALDHFNIHHQILEFEYHTMILVPLQEGTMLLEVTDPIHGVVTQEKEVKKRLEYYTNVEDTPGTTSCVSDSIFPRQISALQLAGLQYYNLAVKLYNNKQLKAASIAVAKAVALYPSERTVNLRDLIASYYGEDLLTVNY
jgi:hypothetical protein